MQGSLKSLSVQSSTCATYSNLEPFNAISENILDLSR